MQLHSTTGEDGYPCPVLCRPGVGVRVGDNFMCCADRAQKNPSTLASCITLFFPIIHASYTPIILCRNPKASYGQTESLVFLSETAALCLRAACWLRCAGWVQGETQGLVVSGSIYSCLALSASHSKRAAHREGVSGETSESLGGGRRAGRGQAVPWCHAKGCYFLITF